jgi:hypothetical protein
MDANKSPGEWVSLGRGKVGGEDKTISTPTIAVAFLSV